MTTKENIQWPSWMSVAFGSDAEELHIWRERFPHLAQQIAEEARAKIDNRDPVYSAPVSII